VPLRLCVRVCVSTSYKSFGDDAAVFIARQACNARTARYRCDIFVCLSVCLFYACTMSKLADGLVGASIKFAKPPLPLQN